MTEFERDQYEARVRLYQQALEAVTRRCETLEHRLDAMEIDLYMLSEAACCEWEIFDDLSEEDLLNGPD